MRIGVTGASGMLGTAIVEGLVKKFDILATSRSKGFQSKKIQWHLFDLTNLDLLNQWVVNSSPDIVIHCAAMVNVDECEKNSNQAEKLHIDTTKTLADYLDANNKKLIYISTDSIFNGEKKSPYLETDIVDPKNIYARTKFTGEKNVLKSKRGLVLRTNIIGFSKSANMSFAEWVLDGLSYGKPLNLFTDVLFSPIHVFTMTEIIIRAIEADLSGLYNCSSKDVISKYDYGMEMARIFNFSNENIKKTCLEDMHFLAKRSKNMALSSVKLSSALGFNMPSAIESIKILKNEFDFNTKIKK